ncbi:MAG: CinA family protein [Gammaproteobacteria bacterium]
MQGELDALAEKLGKILVGRGHRLALAESCTGGWIAQTVTDIPGSSKWFDRGFVTYSNQAKVEMLGVSSSTLAIYGAVSAETAKAMASGALSLSNAHIALAVTGIAGPDGGSPQKPVGLVFLAWQARQKPCKCIEQHFSGGRHEVRYQAVLKALNCLLEEYGQVE